MFIAALIALGDTFTLNGGGRAPDSLDLCRLFDSFIMIGSVGVGVAEGYNVGKEPSCALLSSISSSLLTALSFLSYTIDFFAALRGPVLFDADLLAPLITSSLRVLSEGGPEDRNVRPGLFTLLDSLLRR